MNEWRQIVPGVFGHRYDLDARFTRGSIEGLARGLRNAAWIHFEVFESTDVIRIFVGGNRKNSLDPPLAVATGESRQVHELIVPQELMGELKLSAPGICLPGRTPSGSATVMSIATRRTAKGELSCASSSRPSRKWPRWLRSSYERETVIPESNRFPALRKNGKCSQPQRQSTVASAEAQSFASFHDPKEPP